MQKKKLAISFYSIYDKCINFFKIWRFLNKSIRKSWKPQYNLGEEYENSLWGKNGKNVERCSFLWIKEMKLKSEFLFAYQIDKD